MTCIACKLMESINKNGINSFMINNNLLANLQHGFVPGKSCQLILLSMLSILTDVIEHGHEVDLVYLDFAKVFDSVPHRKLIHKLEKYGISAQLLLWIFITLDSYYFPVKQKTVSTCHLCIIRLGISHQWCLPRECFWSHFIYIIYKGFTKRYLSRMISICR